MIPDDPPLHSIQPSPDDPDTPRPVSPPVLEEDRLLALVSQSEGDDVVGCALEMGCLLGRGFGVLLARSHRLAILPERPPRRNGHSFDKFHP